MRDTFDRHAIGELLRTKDVDAWGVACNTPRLPSAPDLPVAVSLVMRFAPGVVGDLVGGPTQAYVDEYWRLNRALDRAAQELADLLVGRGQRAERIPATTDDGDDDGAHTFPHKTAATSAGLGWIGKTALFVSPRFGPAVRLATVFTDLELRPGRPITHGLCGDCRVCVGACPAGCGRDVTWHAGLARDVLFDAEACRRYMAAHPVGGTEICGICVAACPLARQ